MPLVSGRYLSSVVIAGRQGDYTDDPHRALPDEPEAVSEEWLWRFTTVARAVDAARRQDEIEQRHLLGFDEQVRLYESIARDRHIDVRDDLRAIRRFNDPEARLKALARLREKVERGEQILAA
jgi:hypothetical protein